MKRLLIVDGAVWFFVCSVLLGCGDGAASDDTKASGGAGAGGQSETGGTSSGSGGTGTAGTATLGGAAGSAVGSGGGGVDTGGVGASTAIGGAVASGGTGGSGTPQACSADEPNTVLPEGAPTLEPGIWKEITPPVALEGIGVDCIALDPCNSAVLYAGLEGSGVWRTMDAGSTWEKLASGSDPDPWDDETPKLDVPIALAVDPTDPLRLYASQGVRGSTLGFWISTDGGFTWARPPGFVEAAKNGGTYDVTTMALDPTDFGHLMLGSHTLDPVIMESTDGGTSWKNVEPPTGGGSFSLSFLYHPPSGQGDGKTWLVAASGFWRTTDGGDTWDEVADFDGVHGAAESYFTDEGILYSAGHGYPARSTDNGESWEHVSDGLAYGVYYSIRGDGNAIYTMPDNYPPPSGYVLSPESDGVAWTDDEDPNKIGRGPLMMRFDAANRILYSANWDAGLWALKVE